MNSNQLVWYREKKENKMKFESLLVIISIALVGFTSSLPVENIQNLVNQLTSILINSNLYFV